MKDNNIKQLQESLTNLNEHLFVDESNTEKKYKYEIVFEDWTAADDCYDFELISFDMDGKYKKEDDFYAIIEDKEGKQIEDILVGFLKENKRDLIKDLKEEFILKETENRLKNRFGLSDKEVDKHKEKIKDLLMTEKDLINTKLINETISNYLDNDFDEEEIIKDLEKKLKNISDYLYINEAENLNYRYHITYEDTNTQYSFELTELYLFDIDGSYEEVDTPSGLDEDEYNEVVDFIEDFMNRLKVKYARFMLSSARKNKFDFIESYNLKTIKEKIKINNEIKNIWIKILNEDVVKLICEFRYFRPKELRYVDCNKVDVFDEGFNIVFSLKNNKNSKCYIKYNLLSEEVTVDFNSQSKEVFLNIFKNIDKEFCNYLVEETIFGRNKAMEDFIKNI